LTPKITSFSVTAQTGGHFCLISASYYEFSLGKEPKGVDKSNFSRT